MKQFLLFSILYSIVIYFIIHLLIRSNFRKLHIIFKLWILIQYYSILPLLFRYILKWNFLYEIIKFNKFLSYFIYYIY